MKKLLSMFMVIAIFLSVCAVPVFATQGKGSITITNATKDEVYEVYKIFDADVRLDANNNATAVIVFSPPESILIFLFESS